MGSVREHEGAQGVAEIVATGGAKRRCVNLANSHVLAQVRGYIKSDSSYKYSHDKFPDEH